MRSGLAVVIALVFVFASGALRPVYAGVPVSEPVKIQLAGQTAVLQLVLVKGGKVVDEVPSAICHERVEGTFAVRVTFGNGRVVSTPMNDLMRSADAPVDKLAFCAGPWRIATADYNQDGQVDFNLGQYGTSNGWLYRLFTVLPSGHVSRLPVPGGAIFLADDQNSTDRIQITSQGIKTVSYANACDKPEDCGWWETTYRWSPKLRRFERAHSRHLARYSPKGAGGPQSR